MAACDQVFRIPELVVEILHHLDGHDLERARRINGICYTLVNNTAILQRIRVAEPLNSTNMPVQKRNERPGKYWPANHRGIRKLINTCILWDLSPHYDIQQGFRFHREFRTAVRLIPIGANTAHVWMNLPWTRLRTAPSEADRSDYVSRPPVTTLKIDLAIAGAAVNKDQAWSSTEKKYPGVVIVSTCLLRVKTGIRMGDVLDTQQAMMRAEELFVADRRGCEFYQSRLAPVRLVRKDLFVLFEDSISLSSTLGGSV